MLPQYAELPREKQPRFVFPSLRRRQQRVLNELQARVESMGELSSDAEVNALFDDIEAALADLMLYWENQTDEDDAPIDFDTDDLDRVLDDADLMFLFQLLYQSRLLSLDQKKASALPSGSSPGPSTASLAASLPTEPRPTPTASDAPDATGGTPGGSAGSTGLGGPRIPHGTQYPTTQEPPPPYETENDCGCWPANHAEAAERSS